MDIAAVIIFIDIASVISEYGLESLAPKKHLTLKTCFHHYRVVTQRFLSRSAFLRSVVLQSSNGFDFDFVWENLTLGLKIHPLLPELT